MDHIERILKKLVIIQAIFLILCQIFYHHFDLFPEFKTLTQYEGVNGNSFTKILETFFSD